VLLWCYFVWYGFAAARYFDPAPTLWATSLGLSLIIGTGLYISTTYAGRTRTHLGFWPVFRFYLMPFCVSSFAALIKGHGFILIFHPNLADNLTAFGLCAAFVLFVLACKRMTSSPTRVSRERFDPMKRTS
jgi:hypothetical protein